MSNWQEHTRIIRQHIHALEDEEHLNGSPPAFLGHVKMSNGLAEVEDGLKKRDDMKGDKE